jgi:hypothetical protein
MKPTNRQWKRLLRILICATVFASWSGAAIAQQVVPAPEALHNELRALKERVVTAINKRDEEGLLKELDKNVIFTAMNNDVVRGADEAKAYYQRMMVGAARIVQEMSITMEPDALTTLYADNNVGVSAGNSNAHFKLATREFDIPLRWSATLNRSDGRWRIVSAHFSANIFDNPILGAVEKTMTWSIPLAIVVCLVLGAFLGRWFWRKA